MKILGKKPAIAKVLIVTTCILLVGTLSFSIWHSAKLTKENNRLKAEKSKIEAKEKEKKKEREEAKKKLLNDQASTKTPTTDPTSTVTEVAFRPNAAMIRNLTAILNTMDTQPFEGYVADEVSLYYASNEPSVVLRDKTQIAKSLEYFSDAKTPWDLTSPDSNAAHYKKNFSQRFGDGCLAGHSADANHVVSFCFNKEGKIYSIFFCRDPRVFM